MSQEISGSGETKQDGFVSFDDLMRRPTSHVAPPAEPQAHSAAATEQDYFDAPSRTQEGVTTRDLPQEDGNNPGGTRIATRAVEPSSWGWRGWLNTMFNLKLAPSAKELRERERQALNARIDADNKEKLLQPLSRTNGYCGYLTVASEKGGIGKSTVAALLAWTIAQRRQESVLVSDLNPDLGSLADRLGVTPTKSIRDMVRAEREILTHEQHPHEFLAKVPTANVWVLGGDTDADRREMTGEEDVKTVARVNRPFFAAGVLDNGTGISHSAMTGSLEVSHGMVIVLDNTRGVSKFAHSTLAHLDAKEYKDLRDRVVVVVVESVLPPPAPRQEEFDTREQFARAQQAHAARLSMHMSGAELAEEFASLVRATVVVPYDPVLAAGGAIEFDLLKPATIRAGDTLAAALLNDLVR